MRTTEPGSVLVVVSMPLGRHARAVPSDRDRKAHPLGAGRFLLSGQRSERNYRAAAYRSKAYFTQPSDSPVWVPVIRRPNRPRESLDPASVTRAGTVRVSGEPLSGPRAFAYAANKPTPVLQYGNNCDDPADRPSAQQQSCKAPAWHVLRFRWIVIHPENPRA